MTPQVFLGAQREQREKTLETNVFELLIRQIGKINMPDQICCDKANRYTLLSGALRCLM